MTKNQQRIAIAEWMGYEILPSTYPPLILLGRTLGKDWEAVPNYPEDLNAMHEVEEHPDLDANLYDANLSEIVLRDGGIGARFYKCSGHPFHASASQRSEALCRTLFPERFQ